MTSTILVVDDDPFVRRSVGRVLTRAGFEVVVAETVGKAFSLAASLPLSMAIVDFNLSDPESDGLQVLSRLRELQPGCLRVLMTGMMDYRVVVDAVNRGEVLRVLAKPIGAEALLQTVDDAFKSAKRMEMHTQAQQASVALDEQRMLQECLDRDLLRLAVQPIVSATGDHEPMAYEALLRSLHPDLDGPMAVLGVAERYGRLMDVGARVFLLAADWVARIPTDTRLFVNLSSEQLAEPARMCADVAPLALHAHRVTLEITEQSHLQRIPRWQESVQMLRRMGFSLAVDDLGAGYNSLSMLAQVQPAYVKIDMGLVRDVHCNPFRRRVIELVVNLANATHALVVAEGVECVEEAEVLSAIGCHLLQGYYFGRPSLMLEQR
ncbi:MAG: EAL domain-containing protein, partial [Myxococcota bacterium]